MSYDVRTYDDDNGDPVVVLVATGSHDVSRVLHALTNGNCEQNLLGNRVVRSLQRHNTGRGALALLKSHGGADFTRPEPWWITTDFFANGGTKYVGPFDTRELALSVREWLEVARLGTTYAVDQEPAS